MRPRTIVLTVIDDLGFGDVGYNNPDEMRAATPTMNRLSQEGVKLVRFYASPTCTASRAALMTGRYPMHLGLQDSIIHPSEPRGVPLQESFLSDKLRTLGYYTALVGKWHLGFHQRAYTPLRRGFDTFFGILTGGGDHYAHESTTEFSPRGPEYKSRVATLTGANLWHDDVAVSGAQEGVHTTELYSTKAAEILETTSAELLFLMVCYQAVHAPVQAPSARECAHLSVHARRAMCSMVKMVDDGLRQLEASLLSSGRWNSTAWWVLSDNGGVLRHGSSNGDLRGEKGVYYEGGVRVPAFLTGGLARPREFDGLYHVVDVHASVLALAGYATSDGDVLLDGIDQSCVLHSACNATRTEIVHNVNSDLFGNAGALRVGDFKLVVEARVTESEIYDYGVHMLQDDNWDQAELSQVIHQKLLRSPGLTSLFDVRRNPNELDAEDCGRAAECTNLADHPAYTKIRDALLDRLDALRKSVTPSTEQWADDGPLADPQLFNGVWSPWRDDQNLPYATYQLAPFSLHTNLGGENIAKPAAAAAPSSSFRKKRRLTQIDERQKTTRTNWLVVCNVAATCLAVGFVLGRRSHKRGR